MMYYRWSPFNEFRRMQETLDRLWGGDTGNGQAVESWVVPVDVYEHGDNVVVQASMPGFHPDAIDITIEDGVLTIRGETQPQHQADGEEQPHYLLRERRYGSFYRSLRLPDSVDFDKAETHFANGVLTITFPKLESKRARRLSITGGAQQKAIEDESRPLA